MKQLISSADGIVDPEAEPGYEFDSTCAFPWFGQMSLLSV
jgi:hypothetical protein